MDIGVGFSVLVAEMWQRCGSEISSNVFENRGSHVSSVTTQKENDREREREQTRFSLHILYTPCVRHAHFPVAPLRVLVLELRARRWLATLVR